MSSDAQNRQVGEIAAWLAELRRLAALPLTRCEARMAASRFAMREALVVAAVLDVVALGSLVMELCVGGGSERLVLFAEVAVGAALAPVVLSLIWAIGLGAAGLAGEREADTLESLLLTPMDRRELLWAKLIGRTAPPRRFMLAATPAYLCAAVALVLLLTLQPSRSTSHEQGLVVPLVIALVVLTAAATALSWIVLFFQLHAAAAAALCLSARFKKTLTTGIATYAAIILPAAFFVLSLGFGSLIWAMTLGPVMFKELARNFDEKVMGPDP